MWTYRHPYRPSEFTREYIQERGELALYRALNIRRVIGFIGSGATRAYGRPTWGELVESALRVIHKHMRDANKTGRATKNAVRKLYAQIEDTESGVKREDDKQLILGIAENIARIEGFTDELRGAIASNVVRSRKCARSEIERKINHLFNGHERFTCRAEPLQRLVQDLGINRYLTLNYDVEIEREFRRQFRTRTGQERKGERSQFEILCDPKNEDEPDGSVIEEYKAQTDLLPHRVEYIDGTRRSVASVALDSDHIGELINFALHPRQFDGQVFHLHGRYDKISSMVLTENDYQNTYLRGGEARYTFDEALSALFDGNDVFFVGVGMEEADITRPLRQFVSQDRSPEFSGRHVYCLKEHHFSFPKSLMTPGSKDIVQHIEDCLKEEQKNSDKKDTEFSLKLQSNFGIYTIFHSNDVYKYIMILINILENVYRINTEKREGIFIESKYEIKNIRFLLEYFLKKIENNTEFAEYLEQDELTAIKELIENCAKMRVMPKCEECSYKDEIKQHRDAIDALRGEIRSRLLEITIKNIGKRQKRWWDDWRQLPAQRDARYEKYFLDKSPEQHPTFARHRPTYQSLVNDPSNYQGEFRVIKALKRLALDQFIKVKPAPKHVTQRMPRRVLRAVMPRGAGKGSLLHILQQPTSDNNRLILDTVFPIYSENTNYRYHASFVVHLSFSMEFASVIEALRDFFVEAILDVFIHYSEKADEATKDLSEEEGQTAIFLRSLGQTCRIFIPNQGKDLKSELRLSIASSHFPNNKIAFSRKSHRVSQLSFFMRSFELLERQLDVNLRVFVCLSGLDRLCDSDGVAFNPMYRAFFRLISGCGQKYKNESVDNLPMDLLLIASDRDRPVRYLSQQLTKKKLFKRLKHKEGNFASYLDYVPAGGGIYLKKWPKIGAL